MFESNSNLVLEVDTMLITMVVVDAEFRCSVPGTNICTSPSLIDAICKLRRIFKYEWDIKGFVIVAKNELSCTCFITK
jgi:hypothetical protein